MGYDCYMMTSPADDASILEDVGNYTSNVWQILEFALARPLRELEGRTGASLAPYLEDAVTALQHPDHREHLLSIEPANGWGDLDGATKYLRSILSACRRHPTAFLHVSA